MLTVVCWRWQPRPGYRSTYAPETVLTLRDMVRRHYPERHRFLCVTDDPNGLDGVDVVPDFGDFANLPSPHGGKNPSCYRRLRMFHPEIGKVFGERFVSIDLDVVITGDLRPIWNRSEDIVLYGDATNPQPGSHYNGSMVLMTAGSRSKVWTEFDPETSPTKALAARAFGSDQGWVSYRLGPREAKWTAADGVYSFRKHLQQAAVLPSNARVVVMQGSVDPWTRRAESYAWVREHYRREAVAA